MTHHVATLMLRRMYRQLRDNEVRTLLDRRMRDCGSIDYPEDVTAEIRLNPNIRNRGGIVSTLLHELLHLVEHEKPESWVLEKERALYAALTDRQLGNLMARVFGCQTGS